MVAVATRAEGAPSQRAGMLTMADLVSLRDRVKAATGPDRDLDWAIWFETAKEPADHGVDGWPHYTASIDAALALVENLLPDWGASVTRAVNARPLLWSAKVFERGGELREFWHCPTSPLEPGFYWMPNGALAIVSALLAALSTSQVKEG